MYKSKEQNTQNTAHNISPANVAWASSDNICPGLPAVIDVLTPGRTSPTLKNAAVKASSHFHARHDKTVLSVSRPLRRCELDSRQLKTDADRKSEVRTRSQQSSIYVGTPDTAQTGPSCLGWRTVWIGHYIVKLIGCSLRTVVRSVQFRLLRTRLYRHRIADNYLCQIHYTSLVWLFVYCVCVSVFHVYFVAASDGEIRLRYMVAYNCSVMQTGRWTVRQQEAQLSPGNRAMRGVSWNLASCHATVQKLLVRQVLNQVSAVANWPARQNRAVDRACLSVRSTVVERRSSEVL